jgi:hypothetical protein
MVLAPSIDGTTNLILPNGKFDGGCIEEKGLMPCSDRLVTAILGLCEINSDT